MRGWEGGRKVEREGGREGGKEGATEGSKGVREEDGKRRL